MNSPIVKFQFARERLEAPRALEFRGQTQCALDEQISFETLHVQLVMQWIRGMDQFINFIQFQIRGGQFALECEIAVFEMAKINGKWHKISPSSSDKPRYDLLNFVWSADRT